MNPPRRHHDIGFLLIALFKFVKAIVLAAVGAGALSLLHPKLAAVFHHWSRALQLQADRRFLQELLIKVGLISHHDLVIAATISFVYAALLLTEGVGLWLEKVWAEYLTALITASFIPVEMFELYRHSTASRIILLVVNSLVVGYLGWRLREHRLAVTRKSESAVPGEN